MRQSPALTLLGTRAGSIVVLGPKRCRREKYCWKRFQRGLEGLLACRIASHRSWKGPNIWAYMLPRTLSGNGGL